MSHKVLTNGKWRRCKFGITPRQQDLLDALASSPHATTAELAETLGVSRGRAAQLVAELRAKGVLEAGDGRSRSIRLAAKNRNRNRRKHDQYHAGGGDLEQPAQDPVGDDSGNTPLGHGPPNLGGEGGVVDG